LGRAGNAEKGPNAPFWPAEGRAPGNIPVKWVDKFARWGTIPYVVRQNKLGAMGLNGMHAVGKAIRMLDKHDHAAL
jgi:hypothetical protein